MSLGFLVPRADARAGAVARSPMEHLARGAGARFELRDGWNVAIDYAGGAAPATEVGWADTSHLAKLELQGDSDAIDSAAGAPLPSATALRRHGAWWCRMTATRALVIGARPQIDAGGGVGAVDVTTTYAALTLTGAMARETIARFCALDLRPAVAPGGALRPGSIARQPGVLVCESADRYLLLFGWATGEYMWSVVADAAEHLGGAPIGVDALPELPDA